ncbi:sodium/glutamate symporter [Oscillospiraceae bacterium LTW-04]|nr:sodium/glutamate symporter [Oscillospiraceae bacterium MB24-C1]
MALSFNLIETFGLSVVVLLIGKFLVDKIGFLNKFCIPAPVVGGLLFSLLNLAFNVSGVATVTLDTGLQSFFMICFFTTVGFGASLAVLKKGSVAVIIFLAAASLLCVLQNVTGAGIATLMGESPLLGVAVGSVPMTGGHGTAAAFGPIMEEAGLIGASTIAVAAATFGLVSGSLMGGPVANRLIRKRNLKASAADAVSTDKSILEEKKVLLNSGHLSTAFFQIAVAMGLGSYVSKAIALTGLTVPAYIGSMLVAAFMRNIFKDGTSKEIRIAEIQALGEIFLSIFLAQALMSLKLWELASLALPLVVILLAQVTLMFLFTNFVTFNVMGRDYDAAVLAAGHCGFGMGATPNGVANMTAVVTKYEPSPKAFFVLPIIGGLFIDFINSFIVLFFINALK